MKRIPLCLLALLICAGCTASPGIDSPPPEISVSAPEPLPSATPKPAPSPSPTPSPTPSPPPDPEKLRDEAILSYIDGLTLEEKAAAVFVVKPSDAGLLPVGGIILFDNDIRSEAQVKEDVEKWKAESPIPLWIGADEEGGAVSRLDKLVSVPVAKPAMKYNGDAEAVRGIYLDIGKAMRELGFNVDFAPCADVLTNPANTVIGNRSFSGEPETAAACVTAACAALAEADILAVPKHFPGHGDSVGDSHENAVSLPHDVDRLRSVELVPFKAAIDNGAKAVLAGHISLPEVTGNDIPAALNPDIIDGLLRGELGFNGVVFTDALDMKAITKNYEPGEAAVMALLAGCDALIMPADLISAHAGVIDAVLSGRLPEKRLDEAIYRQLKIKW